MPEDKRHSSIETFKEKVIAHPHLQAARSKVLEVVREPAGKSVALVMGPTGVGKTTLSNRLKNDFLQVFAAEISADRSAIPIVSVEAPASETGIFNWREFYIRILASMRDPAVELDIAVSATGNGSTKLSRLSTLNLTELRRMVETAFRYRSVRVLLIDEAQHIRKMASGRRLNDQMDALKSLASLANVFVVLIGTYELISLVELNGQLARRCVGIHFPRYSFNQPDELTAFYSAINTFGHELLPGQVTDLLTYRELLYKGSAGCIGILKNWLTSALVRAHSEKRMLGESDLEATMLPTSALIKIAEEITEGEGHWRRSFQSNPRLDELLGMNEKSAAPAPRKKVNRPVGVRNPTRDAIGLESAFA